MDIIRRNTDYALRAVVALAGQGGSPVSTKALAGSQNIPYQLACKLLQRLHNAGIVKSTMGPSGGFKLKRDPSKITVRQVVETIQGPIRLNNCKLCRLSCRCTLSPELTRLQGKINKYLDGLTLKQLSSATGQKHKRRTK